jgi:hypothetical protein
VAGGAGIFFGSSALHSCTLDSIETRFYHTCDVADAGKTEIRQLLNGHEGETSDTSRGEAYAPPRQCSTLPTAHLALLGVSCRLRPLACGGRRSFVARVGQRRDPGLEIAEILANAGSDAFGERAV